MEARVETSEVKRQLVDVDHMTVGQLCDRYREVFDEDTRSRNRQYLIKKIKYRIQELTEGGLSELARRKIAELSSNAPIRRRGLMVPPTPTPVEPAPKAHAIELTQSKTRDARLPTAGTVIRRMHNDVKHEIRILENGAEYRGKKYASLSGVARAITSTNWNGFLFFTDALKAAGGGAKP